MQGLMAVALVPKQVLCLLLPGHLKWEPGSQGRVYCHLGLKGCSYIVRLAHPACVPPSQPLPRGNENRLSEGAEVSTAQLSVRVLLQVRAQL